MDTFIPLSVPNLSGNECEYVTKALKDEWVSTSGAYISDFEKAISLYLKVKESVACQSGTAAIHLALIICGVGYNDEVIVPTLTFIAAVNPVKYQHATPIFMDCDDSLTLDVLKLEKFCREECTLSEEGLINNKTKKRIKALIVVHVFGNIANMDAIMTIANKYKLIVIEDATEALGSYYTEGKYKGKFAGTIGDFGAYSFNGNKIITTGGGGMLVANDGAALVRAKYLSTQAKDDPLYYIHNAVGYNYRMTNLQAALGVAQLERIEEFIKVKTENYLHYKEQLNTIEGLTLLGFNNDTRSNHWFYTLIIDKDIYGLDKDELLVELRKNKIETRPIWGLIHEQKPYYDSEAYKIEKATYYISRALNIPCSSNLDKITIDKVVDTLIKLKEKRGNYE